MRGLGVRAGGGRVRGGGSGVDGGQLVRVADEDEAGVRGDCFNVLGGRSTGKSTALRVNE